MRNTAQTGSVMPAIEGDVATGTSFGSSPGEGWLGTRGVGMLNAAENGLTGVRLASRSSEIDEKPWRYHPIPTGPTNRTSRVMYVSTSAIVVRRDSDEHSRPIV